MASGAYQDLSWLDSLSADEQRKEIDKINSRKSIRTVSRYINEHNADLYRVTLTNDESGIYNADGSLNQVHNIANQYVLKYLDVTVMMDVYRRTNPITSKFTRKK